MSYQVRALRALAVTTLLGTGLAAQAAQNDPVGSEFVVAAPMGLTTGQGQSADVASDAVGGTVIAYRAQWGDVYFQRYGADGAAVGVPTQVSQGGAPDQVHATMARDGRFAIVYAADGTDTGRDIRLSLFAADGTRILDNVVVNTTLAGDQVAPDVAMNTSGDVVVAWEGRNQEGSEGEIYARTYWANGAPITAERRVNTSITGNQTQPAVAAAAGEFVVTYVALDGSFLGIFARRMSFGGSDATEPFRVNLMIADSQDAPDISMDQASGNFVVAWRAPDLSGNGIYARRFNSSGSPMAEEFQVNTAYLNAQNWPRVAMDNAGGFTIGWQSLDQGGISPQLHAYARSYGRDGQPRGTQFRLASNLYVYTSAMAGPFLACDGDGDLIATYSAPDLRANRRRGPKAVDLQSVVVDSADPAVTGRAYSYTVSVNNGTASNAITGDGVASGVVADLALPAGIEVNSVSGAGWICSVAADNVATCARPTLQGAAPITAVVTAEVAGLATATATVTANQDDPDGTNNTGSESTQVNERDETPDQFSFTWRQDVALNVAIDSNSEILTGFNVPASISITGGQYSVDNGPFTSQPGYASSGQAVRVRLMSASTTNTSTSATLTVGSVSATFAVTTILDLVPDPFSFGSRVDVARSTLIESDPVTISGIDGPTDVTVANGEYSIDGAAYTAVAGKIGNGQVLRVRHLSGADFYDRTATEVRVGPGSATVVAFFITDTERADLVPDAFDFLDQRALPLSRAASNTVIVTGINLPVLVSVQGPATLVVNGVPAGASAMVSNGAAVQLVVDTGVALQSVSEVTIGSGSDRWTVSAGLP